MDAEVSEGEESSSGSDASDLSERGRKEKREVKDLEKLLAQTKKNRMPFLNMTEQEIMERYNRGEGEEEEDGEEPFLPDLPVRNNYFLSDSIFNLFYFSSFLLYYFDQFNFLTNNF